jgi:hypothetical protein
MKIVAKLLTNLATAYRDSKIHRFSQAYKQARWILNTQHDLINGSFSHLDTLPNPTILFLE